ncbi:hypothetical protein U728_3768 (plasmid) [Clostridium botulinum 202F]|uniref:hypothetical protein n=1 Tax=Clostridium botulinum TaxID=1491 RepID=UPI0005408E79|nr:hypothetical protein [Clostridium botulinum]AIY82215.1 hypothetical protein U728_3768 [Clostridium botulinum 202F]KAI3344488.1 hypothetical protein CIT17_17085 [Clostridium botulinum]KON13511.1 hypothetical protein ACP50_05430 [Clostridium botulinum]MBN1076993.1 hypothetical protein [Clostridium botulinum]MBY6987885.1 hypothetical protein [Clostridium botulinum]
MSKCDCIESVKKGIEEKFQKREDIEKVNKVSLENAALMFTEAGCQSQLYSLMVIEYDYKNRKGEIKHKKEKVNMCYAYCPFCGKKYEK